ncbi:MAG: 3-phosphoserine/phosphohydroxythreonine transaminase, partial [Deltaproteobacteria bacterium]|nr:3-phosphoserine/phosphohydroxythreonine transaminase [Deltaproteobacteria bacterium]
ALPLPALERARDEFLDFQGSGMSIMEHSHRGKEYEAVHNEAIALLRNELSIPDAYHVLFMQGGAHLQFCTLPMNFAHGGKQADFVITGHWAKVALNHAKALGSPRVACTTEVDGKFTRIPNQAEIKVDPAAAYAHLTTNNTIFGTQFHYVPDVGNVPLIADMSSDFLWKKFDVSRYALTYAGAQKNIGPSGIVVVVAHKDFIEKNERKDLPETLKYSTYAKNNSLFNTPPTFAIYMVRNVLAWMKSVGGLAQVSKWNDEKGALLYGALDRMNAFYKCPVEKDSRSYMNVVFRLPTEALEETFVSEAKKAGMVGLKGHRSVGGIRVSTYNAVTVDSVKTLVSFMEAFAKKNG